MWEYVNSKFLIPAEGEKWVMAGLRDAWRRHKRNIKKTHFNENATIEDMLQNRPNEIPEVQFRQLLEYRKDSDVHAMCQLNFENRKKQKWRNRMGPINFARIRIALPQPQRTMRNHQSLKCLLQLVQRKEKKFKQILKLQYLNFRILKVLKKQQMMHLGLCLERSSLVGLDAMVDR